MIFNSVFVSRFCDSVFVVTTSEAEADNGTAKQKNVGIGISDEKHEQKK